MSDKPNYPESKVLRRLSLWAPDPSAENERAQFMWQVKNDNLELVVWTRGPTEKGKPPIRAGLNYENTLTVCDMIDKVIAHDGKYYGDFPLFTLRRTTGETRERVLQSTIRVVQTSEGIIQIGVFDADETRPRILFPFVISRWNDYVKFNGEAVSESEASKQVAKNYAAIFRKAAMDCAKATSNAEHAAMYPPREGAGGAGGGNRQGGTNGRQHGGAIPRQPSTAGYDEFTL